MHDCRKTQMQMTDWLFDETPTNHPTNYMAEIGDCQLCYEQYHELRHALNTFDLAAEAMMPAESYWPGYEADLRVKLAREAAPKRWSWVNWRLSWMVPAAVGLAILLFVVMGKSRAPQNTNVPVDETAAAPSLGSRNVEAANDPKDTPKKPRADKQPKPERKSPSRTPEKKPYLLNDPNPILASFEAPATKHFERAQMLLREFRNAPTNNQATFDLASEKKRARKLLYETIVMRRDAEARGDLPTEEVLSDLEPLLLDIANLPKRPTSDDVMPIKERMQKKEIVAKLQFYATPVTVAELGQ